MNDIFDLNALSRAPDPSVRALSCLFGPPFTR
jgi:hypothetical protein